MSCTCFSLSQTVTKCHKDPTLGDSTKYTPSSSESWLGYLNRIIIGATHVGHGCITLRLGLIGTSLKSPAQGAPRCSRHDTIDLIEPGHAKVTRMDPPWTNNTEAPHQMPGTSAGRELYFRQRIPVTSGQVMLIMLCVFNDFFMCWNALSKWLLITELLDFF